MPTIRPANLLLCLLVTPIISLLLARQVTLARYNLNVSEQSIIRVADILQPRGVTFDNAGNLFTISRDTGTIYKITTMGEVSVIVDLPDGADGYVGPVFDRVTGNLLVARYVLRSGREVLQITPSGAVSVFAAPIPTPNGMAFDENGSLYVSSYSCPGMVAKVTRDGSISTFATNLCWPDGLAFGPDGDLFIGNRGTNQVMRVPTSGGEAAVFASGLFNPMDLEFDRSGRLFAANFDNGTISVIDSSGTVSPFVGGLSHPAGIAFDQQNQLYIADYGANRILKVLNEGIPSPTATATITPSPPATPTVPVPPIADRLTINGGALTTTSPNVYLTLSAANTDNSQTGLNMSFSNDGTAWSDWQPYASTALWQLSAGDGLKTVYGRFKSNSGSISAIVSDTITLDTSVQSEYGVTINNGALYTNKVDVQLKISARPRTAEMQVSNDGGFEGAVWEPYSAYKDWQLMQYRHTEITLLVYVRFRDVDGNVTSVSDSIILDINPPNGYAQVAAVDDVSRLELMASDDVSGVAGMRVSGRPDFVDAGWESFATSRAWDFESKPIAYIQFRDRAGNVSVTYIAWLLGRQSVFLPLVLR